MALCIVYVVLYHVLFAGGLVLAHVNAHGSFNALQAVLAVFCAVNAWICVCEIALLVKWSLIQRQHADFEKKLGVGRLPSPIFLFENVSVRRLFTLEHWAVMWSTYAALDPSYVDTTSFGFCVDVGNGVVTLVPTVVFAFGMTWPFLAPRWLGMLGLVKFYQEFYGTVVYFFQYVFNRRYARAPLSHALGIVVPANGLWLVFPAIGMWASAHLILDGSFDVFR
jgi:hypothetical protein